MDLPDDLVDSGRYELMWPSALCYLQDERPTLAMAQDSYGGGPEVASLIEHSDHYYKGGPVVKRKYRLQRVEMCVQGNV